MDKAATGPKSTAGKSYDFKLGITPEYRAACEIEARMFGGLFDIARNPLICMPTRRVKPSTALEVTALLSAGTHRRRIALDALHRFNVTTSWLDGGHLIHTFSGHALETYQKAVKAYGDTSLYLTTHDGVDRLCQASAGGNLSRFWRIFHRIDADLKREAKEKAIKDHENKLWDEMKLGGSKIALEITYEKKILWAHAEPRKHTTVVIKLAFKGGTNIGIKGVCILGRKDTDNPEFGVKLAAERAIVKLAKQLGWGEEQKLLFAKSIGEHLEW